MTAHAGTAAVLAELRPALLRYLGARGASPSEAEDVLQDVYVTLVEHASGPVAEPRAYLYRAVTNRWLDHRRGAARRQRREGDWAPVDEHDDRPTPEAQTIARQRLQIVERALAALPERTATIFRRFRIDGEPQRAIAADLGISVSAVEKHLHRAYDALVEIKRQLDAEPGAARRLIPTGGCDGG